MSDLKEALDKLAAQPNIAAYLQERGIGGIRGSSRECPVANYLRAEGIPDPSVGIRRVWIAGEDEILPDPVYWFVRDFDTR